MTNRILFVDDDGLMLRLVSRLVEGHFEFETEVGDGIDVATPYCPKQLCGRAIVSEFIRR